MKVGLVYISKSCITGFDKAINRIAKRLDAEAVEIAYIINAGSVDALGSLRYEEINYLLIAGASTDLELLQEREDLLKDRTVLLNSSALSGELDGAIAKIVKTRAVYRHKYIKTFGLTETEVSELINNIPVKKTEIILRASLLECDVIIRYSDKLDTAELELAVDAITKRLGGAVYYSGDKDTTLAATAHGLLTKHGKRLAVAESFTGGNIAAEIVAISGASRIFLEGIVAYSNIAKMHRLDVDAAILSREGAVSNETAYQMAANLLNTSGADIVISTTGYAEPSDTEAGLCFIAVGDKRGIHLFRQVFKGEREDIIESGVKTALFKLINELNKL